MLSGPREWEAVGHKRERSRGGQPCIPSFVFVFVLFWPGNRKAYRTPSKDNGFLFCDSGRGQHQHGIAIVKRREDLVGILEGLSFPVNENAESIANRPDVAAAGHVCHLASPLSSTHHHHRERSCRRGRLFERRHNFIQERLGIP